MLGKRFETFRPSLRRWARALAIAWLVGVGSVAVISITLLNQIAEDARTTYRHEIPNLVNRNRIAIKLERLSSFLTTIVWTRDPLVERRTLLKLQTLAQSFDLDDDNRPSEAASRVVAKARKIMALHAEIRRARAPQQDGDAVGREQAVDKAEQAARQLGDDALGVLNSMSDYVTTDAALTADQMANRIQENAGWIVHGWFAALGVFVTFGMLLLYVFQRHLMVPIESAVRGLEAISGPEPSDVVLPRARFRELDMIGRAVEQYARFAGELRVANVTLRALSRRDGLTDLANRRGFDASLEEACRAAVDDGLPFALMLIDVDHFKSLNDRHGHQVGDQCLRQVASTLQATCAPLGGAVSRYGGEEFAVIVSGASPDHALDAAEQVRAAVERAQLYVTSSRRALAVTVSIGVAMVAPKSGDAPERVIEAADAALYRAKNDGRNRVRIFAPDVPSATQSAA